MPLRNGGARYLSREEAVGIGSFPFDEGRTPLYDNRFPRREREDEKREDGMDERNQEQASPYTCNDYRQEMILLAMRRKLQDGGLAEDERRRLHEEIVRLEKRMGMD